MKTALATLAAASLIASMHTSAATILFENFDGSAALPAGWTSSGSTSVSTDPAVAFSGNNSLNINNLSAPSATLPTLGLAGATTATFSFQWTTDVHSSAFGRTPFIQYSNDGITFFQIATFTIPATTGSIPAHTLFSKTINDGDMFGSNTVSLSNTSTFRIQGDSSGGGTQAPVIVDDVTVTADVPIPEPGSLALLGLGGLMIARRRRG